MSVEYMRKNVITDNLDIGDEKVINQNHLYNIVYSKVMDCNPHTKVKYRMECIAKQIGKDYVIFVPSSAKEPIVIPSSAKQIIIDIRALDVKGKNVLHLFKNIISDFSVNAKSATGKVGKIYMTPSYVSDSKNVEQPKCPLAGKKVTIILDRYSLSELDEYCSMVIAYLYAHYTVKGEPHKMHKYIFKTIRVGQHKKYEFAIPVLMIHY
jgi:hypothetical protein